MSTPTDLLHNLPLLNAPQRRRLLKSTHAGKGRVIEIDLTLQPCSYKKRCRTGSLYPVASASLKHGMRHRRYDFPQANTFDRPRSSHA